jgi:adenylate cyclase
VQSLRLKFSALVVTLVAATAFSFVWLASRQERAALEAGVRKHGIALATNLAGDIRSVWLEKDRLGAGPLIEAHIQQVAEEEGLVGARLIRFEVSEIGKPTETIVASLFRGEQGHVGAFSLRDPEEPIRTVIERGGNRLLVAAPVLYSGVPLAEAQIALDLGILVDPVVRESRRKLLLLAGCILAVGIVGGLLLVRRLLDPIARLGAAVGRITDGDLANPISPTSRDEVGELTRDTNKMRESLLEAERIRRAKERLDKAFGRYVGDYVLEEMQQNPEGSELDGLEREVTIVFADIRSFTHLSAGMNVRDVVSLLNEIFQLVSERLLARGGTIDKFIGSSVMAYFGAPVSDPDHAEHAVRAAIDIERAVAARNQQLGEEGHLIQVGIGIDTGPVFIGTIGTDFRADFTAVGDAVNVAHRLVKLAQPGEILVSEAVEIRLRGTVRMRSAGERELPERPESVQAYSVDPS